MPSVAQADTLDEFKNILASKHFFIKYTTNYDAENAHNESVGEQLDEMIMREHYNSSGVYFEAYDGNNFYTEKTWKFNTDVPKKEVDGINKNIATPCKLKIGNRLFIFSRTEKNNTPNYFNKFYGVGKNTAYYQEVDEDFNFIQTQKVEIPIGTIESYVYNTALSPAVIALFNETDDIYSGKYLYRRAGSGTTADGLEYFDLKAVTGNENMLNAIRYTFEGGVIKKIDIALYAKDPQTGEISGNKTIIEVEDFNTNPDPKYFQLPANFKKIEKAPANVSSPLIM